MQYILNNFVNWFDRVQRRLARARPGSVLIIVVVLIVMLALMGTAFLSTTRNDRYGSIQNTRNTQIDLLVDGVKEIVKAALVNDLTDSTKTPPTPTIRPASDSVPAYTQQYQHLTSMMSDLFLADRTPQLSAVGTGVTTPIGSPPPFTVTWRATSWPLNSVAGNTNFDVPDNGTPVQLVSNWKLGVTYQKGQLVYANFLAGHPGGYYVANADNTIATAADEATDASTAPPTPTGQLTSTNWTAVNPKDYYIFAPTVKNGLPAFVRYNVFV